MWSGQRKNVIKGARSEDTMAYRETDPCPFIDHFKVPVNYVHDRIRNCQICFLN